MPRGRPASFDYDVPLEYVDVEDLLTTLEITVSYVSHGNAGFLCPFHHEYKPSARMSVETTAWLCNGCGEKGKNAISFLAKMRSLNMSEAKRILEERYGGALSAGIDDLESEVIRNQNRQAPEPEVRVVPEDRWITEFIAAAYDPTVWPDGALPGVEGSVAYMAARGFSQETLLSWQIGYDWISDRVAIPVRDADGQLVGFKGRAWRQGHEPKYLVLGDAPNKSPRYRFQTYRKSEVVFGLDRCEPYPERMIVVEGELNVLAMHQHGYQNVVAVAGAEFSDKQARLIIDRADGEVVVFFDAGDAGQKGTEKVVRALRDYLPIRAVLEAPGDANELGEEVVDQLVNGATSALELQVRGLLTVID